MRAVPRCLAHNGTVPVVREWLAQFKTVRVRRQSLEGFWIGAVAGWRIVSLSAQAHLPSRLYIGLSHYALLFEHKDGDTALRTR